MKVISRIFLFTTLFLILGLQVWAQEPAPASPEETESPATGDRIVDGRPALYSFKRAIHPLTWIGALPGPAVRSAQDGWMSRLINRKPSTNKTSGIHFGLDGPGTGGGLGPVVTFFNKNLLGKGIDVEIPLNYTFTRYELYEFRASVPLIRTDSVSRLSFDLEGGYGSRPRDDFFGLGNESKLREDTLVRTVRRQASSGFTAKLNDTWSAGFHAVYSDTGVTSPYSGHSAQQAYTEDAVPGLFTGAILHSGIFTIGQNTETHEDYAYRGSLEQLEISHNESAGKGDFAYWKYRVNFEHFFPLTDDGRKVIAARGFAETNQSINGRAVPFFDMPWLGSTGTLRGFENFRFHDRNAVVGTIEYRYRIWPQMDWGFFLDEGQVAPKFSDLTFSGLHAGYGTRFFVWPKRNLPISVDLARSSETWRLYINVNTSF
jgi:outer membrane protein assembly factor BamA